MNDYVILSQWEFVELELNSNDKILGKLSFNQQYGVYFFLWEPNSKLENNFEADPHFLNVIIFLNQIEMIVTDYIGLEYSIIVFFFKDMTVFPKLYFTIHPIFSLEHLIKYLFHLKLIDYIKGAPLSFLVISSNSINQISLNNYIHSSRFISLKNHFEIYKSLQYSCYKIYGEQSNLLYLNEFLKIFEEKNYLIKLKQRILGNGIHDEIRIQIWPLLLSLYDQKLSEKENINKKYLNLYIH